MAESKPQRDEVETVLKQTALVIMTVDVVLSRITGVDGIIDVLLIKRGRPPYHGMWALPGGKLNTDDASLEEAAQREVREETGVQVSVTAAMQVRTFGNRERDPRGRYVSVAYVIPPLREDTKVHAGDDASEAQWFPASQLPPLAFDHTQILLVALQRLRRIMPTAEAVVPLQRIAPCRCEVGIEMGAQCSGTAYWSVNGYAVCLQDIKAMAEMNSDNAEALLPALLDALPPSEECPWK